VPGLPSEVDQEVPLALILIGTQVLRADVGHVILGKQALGIDPRMTSR
jgi:hypothetical protein